MLLFLALVFVYCAFVTFNTVSDHIQLVQIHKPLRSHTKKRIHIYKIILLIICRIEINDKQPHTRVGLFY